MKAIAKGFLVILFLGVFPARAQDSRLGTFHAERTVDGGAQTALEANRLTVTILGARGDVLATLTKFLPYDVGPPAVGVFETGSCVLLDGFQGILEFYDASGTLVQTLRPLKEALPESERVMPFAVHDFSVTLAISEPGGSGVQLFRYTERGEPVFAAELIGDFASAVVVSNSGASAAVGTARWYGGTLGHATVLVSASGRIESTFPVACSFGAFADGDSLILVAGANEIALLSVADGAVRSRTPIGAGRIALDVAPKDGGFVMLSATDPTLLDGRWRYEDLRVQKIETDGTLLTLPGDFQQSFESARLKRVGGEVLLEIDRTVQPMR